MMRRELYPPDWPAISLRVRERACWRCQDCGMECRRPGEPFDTQRRTMSVHRKDFTPSHCDDSNLIALCAGCHLRADAAHHAANAARTRRRKRLEAGQVSFLSEE